MRRIQLIIGIAAVLLLAACGVTSRHAPPQNTVTGRRAPGGSVLRPGKAQPGGQPVRGARHACGHRPPVLMGNDPVPGAPCTQILVVPVTAQHAGHAP